VLFHPIAGRWGPACLRAATASVETVSPPLEALFYHVREVRAGGGGRDANGLKTNGFDWRVFSLIIYTAMLYAQERPARMSVDTPADRFHNRK
jgi:hypothetical protein